MKVAAVEVYDVDDDDNGIVMAKEGKWSAEEEKEEVVVSENVVKHHHHHHPLPTAPTIEPPDYRFGSAIVISIDGLARDEKGELAAGRYNVTRSSNDSRAVTSSGENIFYVFTENDYCCTCAKKMSVHRGPNVSGRVMFTMDETCDWQCGCFCCCCCDIGKMMNVTTSEGTLLGTIREPRQACLDYSLETQIFNENNDMIYAIHGHACQFGVCCFPCCSPVEFDIRDKRNARHDGQIVKFPSMNLWHNCFARDGPVKVIFPRSASESERALLFSSAILIEHSVFPAQ